MLPQSNTSMLGDMSPEEFRSSGHEMVDWIAELMGNIDQRRVLPAVSPGDVTRMLPKSPPLSGEPIETIVADVDRVIVPGMTYWTHPQFLGYFASSGSGPGVLGELLGAALNANAMLWKTCPASTELERVTLDWLRQMLGLPAGFWGMIFEGASVGTLHAIAAAREQLNDLQIRERGLAGRSEVPRLTVYASEQAHSSVDKAAIVLGLGLNGVRRVAVDESFRMRADELERALKNDKARGCRPVCVVATVGTTSTTSIDPVSDIADICEREGLWLHVDAAYGGSAAIIPEFRHVLAGCERADSIVVNPHKWLFVPIDLSAFYTRKSEALRRAFSVIPEYLGTTEDVDNYMDYGVTLGRRFRALKLWFVLRYFGWDGLAERLRVHIELAQSFADWLNEHASFEVVAPVPLSTVCFRARPNGWTDEGALNELNERLLDEVNGTREVFLSHTKINGKYVLRMAVGGIRTDESHVRRAWEIVQEKLTTLAASR